MPSPPGLGAGRQSAGVHTVTVELRFSLCCCRPLGSVPPPAPVGNMTGPGRGGGGGRGRAGQPGGPQRPACTSPATEPSRPTVNE